MTVRNRILWLLVLVALVFVGGVAAMRRLDEEKFRHVVAERQSAWRASVEKFLGSQDTPLATAADDLASNATTVEATVEGDPGRLARALDDAGLTSRGIQAAWIYTPEGSLLYMHAHAASAHGLNERPIPDTDVRPIFAGAGTPHFYIRLPEAADSREPLRLVEVRGARIRPAFAHDDPARTDGYLLVGRLLGPEGLAELPLLSQDDHVGLRLPDQPSAPGKAAPTAMKYVRNLQSWTGETLAQLVVSNDSAALKAVQARGDLLFSVLIGGGLVLFILLFLLLSRSIVTPLQRIIRGLHREDPASIEGLSTQKSELGELARIIHVFFEQRGELIREMGERVTTQEALRHSEEMLQHSQKMDAVGRLAGGVAHDFNNLLTAIIGYSDLLMHRLGVDPEARRDASLIYQAGQQAAGLTRQLLAFSRKQLLQPKVMDLNAVVGGVHNLLKRIIGEHIQIRTEPAAPNSRIKADQGQIEQVILNLGVNARDAMPRGGRLTIRTANVPLDGRDMDIALPEGEYVALEVSDTGEGMDPATRSRIFEPFFTTKAAGHGTGLGLATVYGIVKQSNGGIEVESERGRGSTFRIFFPIESAPVDVCESAPAPVSRSSRSERILLVEDEEIVRELVREVLAGQGYTVIPASCGTEALEAASAHAGSIDLLISDIVMPRMNGAMVAQRVREITPAVRVLFLSGYSEADFADQGLDDLSFEVLQKPFTPGTLIGKVRDLLGGRQPVKISARDLRA